MLKYLIRMTTFYGFEIIIVYLKSEQSLSTSYMFLFCVVQSILKFFFFFFCGQAVALRIVGDQVAFYGCGFYGAQDALNHD